MLIIRFLVIIIFIILFLFNGGILLRTGSFTLLVGQYFFSACSVVNAAGRGGAAGGARRVRARIACEVNTPRASRAAATVIQRVHPSLSVLYRLNPGTELRGHTRSITPAAPPTA